MPAFTSGELSAEGKKVVVIGGGDTAMDCVRTAIRQGAKSVTCLYRRDRSNMPGSQREVKNAEEEGVVFSWLSAPHSFVGDKNVREVRVQQMRLASQENGARQAVLPVPGAITTIEADLVIKALGFEPEEIPAMFGAPGLGLKRDGTLAVDAKTFMTTLPGVFAAGDIVRGASLVVWAIRDGRDAAQSVQQFLSFQHPQPSSSCGLTAGSIATR